MFYRKTVIFVLLACAFFSNMAPANIWNNNTGDNQWSTPQNWSANVLPGPTDSVRFDLSGSDYANIEQGFTGYCDQMRFGSDSDSSGGTLKINGGALEANGFIKIGLKPNDSNAVSRFEMVGGTLEVANRFFIMAEEGGTYGESEFSEDARVRGVNRLNVGNRLGGSETWAYGWMTLNDAASFQCNNAYIGNNPYGSGELTLNGGQLTVAGPLVIAHDYPAEGHIQFNDGTILASEFYMSPNGGQASMDIVDGMLIVTDTSFYSTIYGYIQDNWITADGGSGTVVIEQDSEGIYVYAQREGVTKAQHPIPIPGTTDAPTDISLSWKAGNNADFYDIYMGTSYEAVRDATIDNQMDVYAGYTDATFFYPNYLAEEQSYYWRIDAINGEDVVKGLVWTFETGLGKASHPIPEDGERIEDVDVQLNWTPGREDAIFHVYLGTHHQTIRNAQTDSPAYLGETAEAYFDLFDLAYSSRYYWRIDTEADGSIVKGDVWSFQMPGASDFIVDTFDTYTSTAALKANWDSKTASSIQLEIDSEFLSWSGNSLRWDYDSNASSSEIERAYSTAQDLTAGRVAALNFWLYAPQPIDELTVTLSDGTQSAYQTIDDPARLASSLWNEYSLALAEFEGIDMGTVDRVTFQLKPQESDGWQVVYLDQIVALPPRCAEGFLPLGDLTGDCRIDLADLALLIDRWLLADYIVTASEPPSAQLRGHWPFDESSGTTATDIAGGFDGQLDSAGAANWQPTGGIENGCLYLDGTFGVTLPQEVFADMNDGFTLSVWVNTDPADMPERRFEAQFGVGDSTGYDAEWDSTGVTLEHHEVAGIWTHWAFVRDNASQTLHTYRDGQLIALAPATSSFAGADATRIGGSDTSEESFFKGLIDELKIYAAPLEHSEVLYIAKGPGATILQPVKGVYFDSAIIDDGTVDFADFTAMAANWLDEVLWP